MRIDYRDFGLGGWEQLIKQTTEKYGPPKGDARTALWNDGTTSLTLSSRVERKHNDPTGRCRDDGKVHGARESCFAKVLRSGPQGITARHRNRLPALVFVKAH